MAEAMTDQLRISFVIDKSENRTRSPSRNHLGFRDGDTRTAASREAISLDLHSPILKLDTVVADTSRQCAIL